MPDQRDDSQSRRDAVEPVPLKAKLPTPPGAGTGGTAPARDALLRKLTIAGFSLLLVLAIGVFFFLPEAVERRGQERAPEAQASPRAGEEPQPPSATLPVPRPRREGSDDAEALAQRRAAEDALADFAKAQMELERRSVTSWADQAFQAATARAREGEQLLRSREYAQARPHFSEALTMLQELSSRGDRLHGEALRAGGIALQAGSAAEALEQFELAALLDPDDPAAAKGLARAATLEEVFALLAAGEASEAQGDLAAARDSYQRALALDPDLDKLRRSLERVSDQQTRDAFQAAMSRAFSALARRDYAAAELGFQAALRVRPGAPEARDGLAQAREGATNRRVAALREAAENFEAEERWHEAAQRYQQVLEIDPALAFAQRGLPRCQQRAGLADALDRYLNAPDRLSSAAVRREAGGVLAQTDSVRAPGPVLRSQIDRLAELIELMSAPVPVELISDAETDILVYHVGRLGRFEARRLELAPGRYTVVGTRDGYRDVRKQFTVDAGVSPAPVTVRCEERI